MSSKSVLNQIVEMARPHLEAQLDAAEQIAALREYATQRGFDWSQIKALLKAQIQDERDDAGDGKRVRRIVEKADAASAYAGLLGFVPEKVNEEKNTPTFAAPVAPVQTSIVTQSPGPQSQPSDMPDIPQALRRVKPVDGVSLAVEGCVS